MSTARYSSRSIVCPSPLHFASPSFLAHDFLASKSFAFTRSSSERIVARCDSPLNWHTYVGSAHARSAGEFSTSTLTVSHADLYYSPLSARPIFLFLISLSPSNYRKIFNKSLNVMMCVMFVRCNLFFFEDFLYSFLSNKLLILRIFNCLDFEKGNVYDWSLFS